MIEMKATHRAPIKLGHTGENEAVRVAFSLLPFKETFPDGVPSLLARRKGDASAYPVPLTIEADTAYWSVTRADTEKAGFGQCELQWIVGNTLAKSDKFDFFVVKALEAGAEAPDAPSKAWFEAIQAQIGDLSKLTTKAKENLVAAINEAARTGGGSGGGTIEMRVSGGYIQYSNDGVTWENLIAVSELKGDTGPQGIQGLKGDPGKDGATGPAGKDGLTPTIGANGNWYLGDIDTQKPSRGEKGDPGEKGADGAAGKDGYSPEATVTPINGGAKIIIKDKTGTTSANVMNGAQGPKGDSYTLTTADKSEIAEAVVAGGVQAELGDEPVSLGISGAQVGQIAKITAVDAQGKPTAWEPVDMASGGEREWVEIGEVTTTEDTTEKMIMKFTQDVHGNPLSLKGVLIIGKPIFSDTNKHQCLLVCNDNKYGGNANYLLYEQILRNNQTFTVYSEFLRADGLNSVAVTAFNSGNVKQNGGCGTSVNTWSPGKDTFLQFPMRGVTFTILDTGLLAGSNFKFWGVNA